MLVGPSRWAWTMVKHVVVDIVVNMGLTAKPTNCNVYELHSIHVYIYIYTYTEIDSYVYIYICGLIMKNTTIFLLEGFF